MKSLQADAKSSRPVVYEVCVVENGVASVGPVYSQQNVEMSRSQRVPVAEINNSGK